MQEGATVLDALPPSVLWDMGRGLELEVGEGPPIAQPDCRDLDDGDFAAKATRLGERGYEVGGRAEVLKALRVSRGRVF